MIGVERADWLVNTVESSVVDRPRLAPDRFVARRAVVSEMAGLSCGWHLDDAVAEIPGPTAQCLSLCDGAPITGKKL